MITKKRAMASQGAMILLSPIFFGALIMSVLGMYDDLKIMTGEFRKGTFNVLDIDCYFSESRGNNPSCSAEGYILTEELDSINLGYNLGLGDGDGVDFERKTYPVFYCQGKPIVMNLGELQELDKKPYTRRFWTLFTITLVVVSGLVYLYLMLEKITKS